MPSSLYAEGGDGIRVLSARYRARAIAQDVREEVRVLEAKIKDLSRKIKATEADLKAVEANTQFLAKLEGFTGATLTHLTDKGQLDSEKTISLVNFIREGRAKAAKEEVALRQLIESTQEELAFQQRLLAEKSGRDRADRAGRRPGGRQGPGRGRHRPPQLPRVERLLAAPVQAPGRGKDADKVQVEYLAAITQQTGEDWGGVSVTLSTAQRC
jgi:hypothetical protein